MRSLVVLLACLGLAGVFAGCADFDDVGSPAWQSGYAFTYETESEFQAEYRFTVNGEVEDEGKDQESEDPQRVAFEVLSTQIPDRDVPMYLVGVTFPGEDWPVELLGLRQSDLAVAQVSVDETCALTCPDEAITYEPVEFAHDWLRFPLQDGDTWTDRIPLDEEVGMEEELQGIDLVITANVDGSRKVDTPDGTVEAVRVVHTFRFSDLERLIELIEEEMRDDGMEDVDLSATLDLRLVLYYAPALQTVVRAEATVAVAAEANFRDGSDRYHADIDFDGTAVTSLVGVSYTAAPDRTVPEVLAFLAADGSVQVPDKVVDTPPPVAKPTKDDDPRPVSLRVTGDMASANAAEAPTVTFTATAPDGSGLASDLSVDWRVVDGAGRSVADGNGRTFAHAFTEPGSYSVLAEARDGDGRLRGTGSARLPVDYRTTEDVACDPVIALGVSGCDSTTFPVGVAAAGLTVTGSSTGPASLGLDGTLVVTAPDGTTFEATGAAPTVELAAGDLLGRHGTWSAQWSPDVGVLEEATYDIAVSHGTAPGGPTPTSMRFMDELLGPVLPGQALGLLEFRPAALAGAPVLA